MNRTILMLLSFGVVFLVGCTSVTQSANNAGIDDSQDLIADDGDF